MGRMQLGERLSRKAGPLQQHHAMPEFLSARDWEFCIL